MSYKLPSMGLVVLLSMIFALSATSQSDSKTSSNGYFYFQEYNLLVERSALNDGFYPVDRPANARQAFAFAKIKLVSNQNLVVLSLYDDKKSLVTSISYSFTGKSDRRKVKIREQGNEVERKLEVYDLALLD